MVLNISRDLAMRRKAVGTGSGIATTAAVTVMLAFGGCGDSTGHRSAHPVTIGRGRTFAGTSFVATLPSGTGKEAPGPSPVLGEREPTSNCPLNVAITENGGSSYVVECYDRMESPVRPKVECVGGLLTIHMQVASTTRSVRLTLSNGQSMTSPVIRVPRRLGGPARVYYQAVRGPSPIPVSVTELSGRGQVLQTVAAPRVVECMKGVVRHLPGSGRVLVKAVAPGRREFAISTEETRILGRTNYGLRVTFRGPMPFVVRSAALRLAQPAAGVQVASPAELGRIAPLEWQVIRVCKPYRYTILYGVLTSESDEVLVRSGHGRDVLRRVAIPVSVRPHSLLVYDILGETPSQLIVDTPAGKTIVDEDISSTVAQVPCA
jgi:hypothetical protein